MAFVPDDAQLRRHADKLTPAAWYVYQAHCRARNHELRRSYASKERIAREEGLALKTVKNAMSELRRMGWIKDDERGVYLLVGDFSPVDKKHQKASLNKDSDEGKRPELGPPDPGLGTQKPGLGTENPESRTGAYIERARGLTSPLSSQETSTHTPAPPGDRPPAANGSAPGSGSVCVSGSKFSEEIREAYARNNTDHEGRALGDGWVIESETGRFDQRIAKWLAEREQLPANGAATARDVSQCPDCRGSGMYYPAGGDTPEGRRAGAAKCRHERLGDVAPAAASDDLPPAEFAELLAAIEALVEAQGRAPEEVIAAQCVSESDRHRLLAQFRGRAGPTSALMAAAAARRT